MITINGKSMKDYIKEQAEKGEVLENVYGTRIQKHRVSQFSASQIVGVNNNFLLTNNARVTINRGGKRYTLKGDRIEKRDGQWYVDGKAIDWEDLGGKYEDENVSVEIYGNVERLQTRSGDIKVVGDVQNITTTSGDVECQSAYNINTTSGDVTCGPVGGSVNTISGDISRR
jgi:hypothetical protein